MLTWPVLEAVQQLGGSATIPEITERVAKNLDLTDEQQSIPRGQGRTELEYRLAWARTKLKLAGLLTSAGSKSGVWSATELGQQVQDASTVQQLYKAYEAAKKAEQARAAAADDVDEIDGDEVLEGGVEDWRDELLNALKAMEPAAFERLAQRLLREAGFLNVTVMGKSGDGGIDGVGTFRNGLVSWTVWFQCKRYRGSVGAPEVRDFRGAMSGRGEKGLLITTGTFTAGAKDEANRDGAPSVDLVDGVRLCDLLREFSLGVTSIPRTVYDIHVDQSFFASL